MTRNDAELIESALLSFHRSYVTWKDEHRTDAEVRKTADAQMKRIDDVRKRMWNAVHAQEGRVFRAFAKRLQTREAQK